MDADSVCSVLFCIIQMPDINYLLIFFTLHFYHFPLIQSIVHQEENPYAMGFCVQFRRFL